ncbi:type II CAAX prenyl endopeptidase Rce1 family protein [Nocardia sp. NPDC052566]|uniref:CPBP family glutamic-type intramembrane protease n=1 Tax=Nocardia sp. NPDC052566 TaxID=3364330 RepID=UPI0037C81D0D
MTILITRKAPDWPDWATDLYRWSGWTAFVFAALALWVAHRGLGLSAAELGLRNPRTTWTGFLGATGIGYLVLWLGLMAMMLFPEWTAPGQTPGHDSTAEAVVWSVRAGVVEETVLLALPMAIMTRLRCPWWVQLAVLTALRLPFHLYYGPAAIALALVWCALARFAYSRIRLIWPFMAAHVLYDLNVSVVPLGPIRALITLVMLIAGAVAFATLWRERQRTATESVASRSAVG